MKASNDAKEGQGASLEGAALEVAVDKYIAKHRPLMLATRLLGLVTGGKSAAIDDQAAQERRAADEAAVKRDMEQGGVENAAGRMQILWMWYAQRSQPGIAREWVRRLWQLSPEFCEREMEGLGVTNAIIYAAVLLPLVIVGGIVWLCC